MLIRKDCRGISRLVWDYINNQLSERDVDRVEIHVSRCSRCRRELQSYRLTVGLVSANRQAPEPESKSTWHALRTQLEHVQMEDSKPRLQLGRRGAVLPVWTGAVAAGAILASVWSINRPMDSDRQDALIPQENRGNAPIFSDPPVVVNPPVAVKESPKTEIASPRVEPVVYRPSIRKPKSQLAASVANSSEKSRDPSATIGNLPAEKTARSNSTKTQPNLTNKGEFDLIPESNRYVSQREFVMGGIPTSGPRIIPVSTSSEVDEAPVW